MMELPNSPTARIPAMTVRTLRVRPFMKTSHRTRSKVTMPRCHSRPEEARSRSRREILPGHLREAGLRQTMPSRRSSHPRNPQRDHTQRIGWSAARTQYPLWAGTPGKGPDLPAACRFRQVGTGVPVTEDPPVGPEFAELPVVLADDPALGLVRVGPARPRSEEHTSELQ